MRACPPPRGCCDRAHRRSSTTAWATCARSTRRWSTSAPTPELTARPRAGARGRRRSCCRAWARCRRRWSACARSASTSCCASASRAGRAGDRPLHGHAAAVRVDYASSAGPRASGLLRGPRGAAGRRGLKVPADRLEPGLLAARQRRSTKGCPTRAPSTTRTRSRRGRRNAGRRARHGRLRQRVRQRGGARRRSTGCSPTPRSRGPTGCALLANFVRAARGAA